MARPCSAAGCSLPRSGDFSAYCNSHKTHLRRHGHAEQEAITKTTLRAYVETVRERIAANAENPGWAILEQRWAAVVRDAEARVASYRRGQPSFAHTVKAAEEVLLIAGEVSPRAILETVAGMLLMLDVDGRRFKTDRSFKAQVVRRVRALCASTAPAYRDPRTGKARRAYREPGPRTVAILGGWLIEALGLAGTYIARREREDLEARRKQSADLHKALQVLA